MCYTHYADLALIYSSVLTLIFQVNLDTKRTPFRSVISVNPVVHPIS